MPVAWQVHGPVSPLRYKLTDSVARSGTLRSIGSLTSGAPAGTVTDGRPSNVTTFSLPPLSSAPPSVSATRAAPIVSALAPYSFVSRSRTREPPTLSRTIWRTVCSLKLGVAGNGPAPGLGGSGEAPQLPIHFGSWAWAASAASARRADST